MAKIGEIMFYILWEVEIKSDQLGNLAEISKQSVKEVAFFLLTSYGKI